MEKEETTKEAQTTKEGVETGSTHMGLSVGSSHPSPPPHPAPCPPCSMLNVSTKAVFRDFSLTVCKYAQRARTIVNRAVINEDPNAKIIRGLLKKQLRKMNASIQGCKAGRAITNHKPLNHKSHAHFGAFHR